MEKFIDCADKGLIEASYAKSRGVNIAQLSNV